MTKTRTQIIEKTCELLELQGYHATGLNQIIRESGSPKGSLYYYFPGGKEELAAEAVQHVGEVVLKRIRVNLALEADAAQAIRAFIYNIAFNVEQSGFRAGGPITTIAMESAAGSDTLRETCQRIYDGWQVAFADKLRAATGDEARAASIATLIISAIEGGVILCRTNRSRTALEQVAEEVYLLIDATI
jgi:TetR/AcrR family transcriptional regulator, lmrAB and yxaGH operons repressor